jgi:uncharacterized protein (TIGR03435 family)
MRLFLTILLLTSPLFAEGPEFDVASIKPFEAPVAGGYTIPASGGGPGTADPTHINAPATNLKTLLARAFDVMPYQVLNADSTDMFNFALGVPEGATKDDVKIMWRNLLISRFGLKYHMGQREFQTDELTVSPKGHKLVENNESEPPPGQAKGPVITLDKDKNPVLARPTMIIMFTENNGSQLAKIVARAQPISALLKNISNLLKRPVVDKTGLTGKYDFSLEYSPVNMSVGPPPPGTSTASTAAPAAAADPGVDLPGALEQQLGLRLVKGKSMLDVVVVDKINRTPTEN